VPTKQSNVGLLRPFGARNDIPDHPRFVIISPMTSSIITIALPNLFIALGLVGIVAFIHFRWSLNAKTIFYAASRMLLQLAVVGFGLTYLFLYPHPLLSLAVLLVMLVLAGWIALRPLKTLRKKLYTPALSAIGLGSLFTLLLVIFGVIRLDPWYEPRFLIPIAGMIFSNAMNSVSLAAERFEAERGRGVHYLEARKTAYQASLIPIVNSFFAVGLVAIPGMMTGQLLAGVPPLTAIRYQIMVMCMLLGASGISSALYLTFLKHADDR